MGSLGRKPASFDEGGASVKFGRVMDRYLRLCYADRSVSGMLASRCTPLSAVASIW